jgi:SAM-dependent methyltransferase
MLERAARGRKRARSDSCSRSRIAYARRDAEDCRSATMSPEEYDAWYRTPRGAWIGDTEYRLLRRLLAPEPGASVLDVGCGTGYFSRRFARDGHPVTGIDVDPATVAFARARREAGEAYGVADACALPFVERAFDHCISVTALCFVRDERTALTEMVRVARRGVALGLLNRRSLLYWQKGRRGGRGAYRGARWHTRREILALASGLALGAPRVASAVVLASGSPLARALEGWLPGGAFLALAAARTA